MNSKITWKFIIAINSGFIVRWVTLQEILTSWQQYRNEEQRLNDWLYEKEKSLKAISVIDMGDKKEVQKQLQKLKVILGTKWVF